MGERRSVYRVVVGKHRGKRPPGRPELRWEDDVRMVVEEIVLNGVEWIDLAWDRDK
jgi:hypothetical protein